MKVLLILSFTALLLLVKNSAESKSLGALPAYNHSFVKIEAFGILETKCNICHVKQNRKKIFTLENMDRFAPKI